MRNSPLKQTVLFVVGCVVNLIFFSLSKYLSFPLWLDYTGSFYITVMCGPILGFISVLVHTLLLVILVDGAAALWLFLPAAAICAVLTMQMKAAEMRSEFSNWKIATLTTTAAWVMNFLSFICSPNLPGRYFIYNEAFKAICNSNGKFISSLILSAGITLPETLISLALLLGMIIISPKSHNGLSFRK